ncbi:MAG: DUF3052 family protein [Alphaproteobacteria bacterium]|nr:DUF3052 family protein [Alphaproteobacteria bacterium]
MPTEVAELLSEPRYPVREVVATAAAGCLPLGPWDAIHLFATAQAELERALPALRAALVPDGMIWVSWPKKPARVATDVSENTVRAAAHACHMVDLKVCAVDATWSGLKLVIRRADRATGAPPS